MLCPIINTSTPFLTFSKDSDNYPEPSINVDFPKYERCNVSKVKLDVANISKEFTYNQSPLSIKLTSEELKNITHPSVYSVFLTLIDNKGTSNTFDTGIKLTLKAPSIN